MNSPTVSRWNENPKYSIERNVTHSEVLLHLKNYRDELLNKSLMQQLSKGQQQELQQADQLLRTIREQPGRVPGLFIELLPLLPLLVLYLPLF